MENKWEYDQWNRAHQWHVDRAILADDPINWSKNDDLVGSLIFFFFFLPNINITFLFFFPRFLRLIVARNQQLFVVKTKALWTIYADKCQKMRMNRDLQIIISLSAVQRFD